MKSRLSMSLAALLACAMVLSVNLAAGKDEKGEDVGLEQVALVRAPRETGGGEAFHFTLRGDGRAFLARREPGEDGRIIEIASGRFDPARLKSLAKVLTAEKFEALRPSYGEPGSAVVTTVKVQQRGAPESSVQAQGDSAPDRFGRIVAALLAEREAIRWSEWTRPAPPPAQPPR